MPANSKDKFPENVHKERPLVNAASGCLYALYVVGISGGLLFLNALFCLTIYPLLPKASSEQVSSRVGQMFYFIVPVLLLVVEWNLYDRIQRLFRRGTN